MKKTLALLLTLMLLLAALLPVSLAEPLPLSKEEIMETYFENVRKFGIAIEKSPFTIETDTMYNGNDISLINLFPGTFSAAIHGNKELSDEDMIKFWCFLSVFKHPGDRTITKEQIQEEGIQLIEQMKGSSMDNMLVLSDNYYYYESTEDKPEIWIKFFVE